LVLNNPTEKYTLGCARILSEASWLSILEDLSHSFEDFHSHSSCCCQQGTSDLAEVGLKLLTSLKTYTYVTFSGVTRVLRQGQTSLKGPTVLAPWAAH